MKNIIHAFSFFSRAPGLHAFAKDRATVAAIRSLERRGALTVSWNTHQAEFTG